LGGGVGNSFRGNQYSLVWNSEKQGGGTPREHSATRQKKKTVRFVVMGRDANKTVRGVSKSPKRGGEGGPQPP